MKNEATIRTLEKMVKQSNQAREDIAVAVAGGRVSDLWSQTTNFVAMAIGERAEKLLNVIERIEPAKVDDMLNEQMERLTEDILDGYITHQSTNQLSNAFGDCELQAARQFRASIMGVMKYDASC